MIQSPTQLSLAEGLEFLHFDAFYNSIRFSVGRIQHLEGQENRTIPETWTRESVEKSTIWRRGQSSLLATRDWSHELPLRQSAAKVIGF